MFDQNNPRIPVDFSKFYIAKNKQRLGQEVHLRKKDSQNTERYVFHLFSFVHFDNFNFVSGRLMLFVALVENLEEETTWRKGIFHCMGIFQKKSLVLLTTATVQQETSTVITKTFWSTLARIISKMLLRLPRKNQDKIQLQSILIARSSVSSKLRKGSKSNPQNPKPVSSIKIFRQRSKRRRNTLFKKQSMKYMNKQKKLLL